MAILDENTRECLAIDVARQMSHRDVMDRLAELFIERGVPECLRSDNGSEFTAQAIRDWLKALITAILGDGRIGSIKGHLILGQTHLGVCPTLDELSRSTYGWP